MALWRARLDKADFSSSDFGAPKFRYRARAVGIGVQRPCSDGGLPLGKELSAVPAPNAPSPSSHWRHRLRRALMSPRLPPRGSPYPKLDLRLRLLARLADAAIAAAIVAALRCPGGPLLAALFLLVADALFQGQSPGKKCFGLKVVHLQTRQGAGIRASAQRNALAALCPLLALIPTAGVWLALLSALGLALAELLLARAHPLGMRLGDRRALTQVIDGKDVAGSAARLGDFAALDAKARSIDGQQAFATAGGERALRPSRPAAAGAQLTAHALRALPRQAPPSGASFRRAA